MATNKSKTETETSFDPAKISENAEVVLKHRYLLKNDDDEVIETPDQLFRRVANALAEEDKEYGKNEEEIRITANKFYEALSSLEFLANSPTLMNAGTPAGTLSACFVLPLKDSMEDIMKAAHDAAMVQKFGGGTGFALSELRPKGASIKTTHGKACGPIAALRLLSSVSTLVTQGGKRDGANMAVMNVHHPDILEFVDCKTVEGEIHNFNISVGATNNFMEAVVSNGDYDLIDPVSGQKTGSLNAKDVFEKIVKGAWKNGEPGMIFLDEVNRKSPVNHIGEMTATNPCGEQPLLPNESCNLGSINVSKFVIEKDTTRYIDWDRLKNIVHLTVHFLDNTIDANKYAILEIEEMNKQTRKIGLGVMGFADLLIKLKIRYDSEEGLNTGKNLMKFIMEEADKASEELAKNRGPFESWEGSRPQLEDKAPLRNACRLTVAPTGTISMIAGCSSGIEPIFSLAFRKQNILEGKTLYYVDKNFEAIAKKRNFYSEKLLEYLSEGGSLQNRDDVPNDVKEIFKTAPDITPENHVRMQAAFQDSVDAGISKTINFPNSATEDDVSNAYMLAWELACKGITVYRAGSREKEVLTSGTTENQKETEKELLRYVVPRERPSELSGVTQRVRTGRGNLYITVNMSKEGYPFEVFATHGKAGGNDAAMAEAVSRMVSLCLRSGIDPKDVTLQLKGISDMPAWDEGELIKSVPDAVALVLERVVSGKPALPLSLNESSQTKMFESPSNETLGMMITDQVENVKTENNPSILAGVPCPECQNLLAFEEGCEKCYSCGFSKC
jgi:ribonucleoside-diphosphate reductase alpha chain